MRVLDLETVLGKIFDGNDGLDGPIERIEFIHHNERDVYRVKAGGRRYIAHVSADDRSYLGRLHNNLTLLASLKDERIPQVVAWRRSGSGPKWGALICREIPGDELNRANASPAVLAALEDLLFRVHSTVGSAISASLARRVDEVAAFPAFAETLLERLADLPIRLDRVRRHTDEMARFVREHAERFDVSPRLIHGDLHRSNIVVFGSRLGLLDWGDLGSGDYAFDLATLKFVLDSVAPERSRDLIRRQARRYREHFGDTALELRMRFFLALAGLIRAFHCAGDESAFRPSRAWRVRACYLHSEAQWRSPLVIDGPTAGAPVARTEDFAVDMRQPIRGLFYLVAPKRVS